MSDNKNKSQSSGETSRLSTQTRFIGLRMVIIGFILFISGLFLVVYSLTVLSKQPVQEDLVQKPDPKGIFLYDLSEFLSDKGTELPWTKREEANFVVSYYSGDRSEIDFAVKALNKALPRIAKHLGSTIPKGKIQVVIFPSMDELNRYIDYTKQQKVSGLAVPQLDTIFIPLKNPNQPADFVAVHELTHLLLRRAVFPYSVPLWLDEGIATYEGVNNPGTNYRVSFKEEFRRQAATSDFLTIREMEQVGDTGDLSESVAGLWYVESYSLIDFIARNYGESKFQLLLDSLKTGSSSSEAVKYALGLSLEELEVKWRSNLSGVDEKRIEELISSGDTPSFDRAAFYQKTLVQLWLMITILSLIALVLLIYLQRRFMVY